MRSTTNSWPSGFIRRTIEKDKLADRKGPERLRWDLRNAVDARLERHKELRLAALDRELEEHKKKAYARILEMVPK